MKIKVISALLTIMLAVGSLSFGGDLKPFEGWSRAVYSEPLTLAEVKEYPYMAQIISQFGEPDPLSLFLTPPGLVTYESSNNVGGASTITAPLLVYFKPLDPFGWVAMFYEDQTVTVANGDQIFVNVEGTIFYPYPVDPNTGRMIAKETVVGGTGRFEGATGSYDATTGFDNDGQTINIYSGYIETIGKAK